MKTSLLTISLITALTASIAFSAAAQAKKENRPAAPIVSPDIQPGGKVTFRLLAPKVNEVTISGEFITGQPQKLTRDDRGLWSITLDLKPNIYWYLFNVDGVSVVDPRNPRLKTGSSTQNYVEVPGDPPMFYADKPVPHGDLHVHTYNSKATGTQRRVYVWTPPGYNAAKSAKLPVLYLLHGSGDDESGWSAFGRAHLIADNLTAEGKMKPMVIVMPNGHAYKAGETPAPGQRGTSVFKEDLIENIIPLVERSYHVQTDQPHRAIMGLSMGGSQSFTIGLSDINRFSHVGIYSSGGGSGSDVLQKVAADPKAANTKLKLVWIGCGRADRAFEGAQKISDELTKAGVNNTFHPSEGGHTWVNWRDYLHETLPLLFR